MYFGNDFVYRLMFVIPVSATPSEFISLFSIFTTNPDNGVYDPVTDDGNSLKHKMRQKIAYVQSHWSTETRNLFFKFYQD